MRFWTQLRKDQYKWLVLWLTDWFQQLGACYHSSLWTKSFFLCTGSSARGQVSPVPWQCYGCQSLFPEGSGAGAWQQPSPAGGESASVWQSMISQLGHDCPLLDILIQASTVSMKRSDTERFKRRLTRVAVNSQWESQEARLFTDTLLLALTWFFFFTSTMHGIEERPVVAVKQLIYYCIVTEYQKSLCQLKNAGSILEYEKMAEIGFEKRDFRMVSYTVVTIWLHFVSCVVCHETDMPSSTDCNCVVVVSRLFFAWIVPWSLPQPVTGSRYWRQSA